MSVSPEDEPCDAETQEAFIATCVSEASSLALLFAHEPEKKMAAALCEMRGGMEAGLREIFGEETAADLCDLFIAEVRRRRAAIEVAAPLQMDQRVMS